MRSTSPISTSSRLGGWAALALLAACAQPAAGDGGSETGDTPGSAGPAEMWGIWAIGFETSNFVGCASESDCPEPGEDNGCWLDFTSEAAAQLDPALRDRRDHWRYRMRIRGTREEGAGGYGHLGAYECQITAEEILSMERVP
ncbi:hypothetical protein [Parasphingopyxis marina]|uniref:Lipoprotein n=1 Tax=Parasphingopyxis marina TaxID=2761622 RepID=A0A842HV72_9SPHN|nr:hypothetical protein [Parasphingopyxis marina]MBC2776139.1 hypothetical protein [Parasphingopyxis marina]